MSERQSTALTGRGSPYQSLDNPCFWQCPAARNILTENRCCYPINKHLHRIHKTDNCHYPQTLSWDWGNRPPFSSECKQYHRKRYVLGLRRPQYVLSRNASDSRQGERCSGAAYRDRIIASIFLHNHAMFRCTRFHPRSLQAPRRSPINASGLQQCFPLVFRT